MLRLLGISILVFGLSACASQEQRSQELGAAIINGDTEKAKALLSAGADPNAEVSFTRKRYNRGRETYTRLLVAAIVYRRSEIVYALLDRGVSFAEHDNAFAICPAVNTAQVKIVAALIKAGINVNPSFTCIRRLTPLESAKRRLSRLSESAERKRRRLSDIIKMLVEAGAK